MFHKHDITRDALMLHGLLRRQGYDWWWHSFTAQDAETGEDVTYTKLKATYEWVSIPDVANPYQNIYYLDGGMAMHINIKSGKYKIQVYTPFEKQNGVKCSGNNDKTTWTSNIFEYDTANPAKVIFVCPTANDNGFYDGGWYIDYKAPKWFKFTKPKRH